MEQPRTDLPEMPQGYGVPENEEGVLDWEDVEQRLADSLHYWMATTRPDGRPHVVPRWGVWLAGKFWYDGSPATLHTRNLTENPACTLHLEDGWEAVIVDGVSNQAESPGLEFGGRLSEAFAVKYAERGYTPEPDAWEGEIAGGLRVFTPQKAMAWFNFPTDVTRFQFG